MARLLDEYPHNERFQLTRDGKQAEKLCLPVHVHDYDWALLSGRGDDGELRSVLATEDLDLDELQPSTGLNVGLFAIDYRQSDVGKFKEYYLVVAARERAIPGGGTPVHGKGLFVWDIQLDADLPIRAGRQIWGHPKTWCEASVGFQDGDFRFRYAERNGQAIAWGHAAGAADLAYSFVRFPSFFFITPYELRRSWAEAINEGHTAGRAFDPSRDELGWNVESRMGSKLSRVGFQPRAWTLGRNMSAVALR